MNLDELRSVRRTERQKDSLQHLRDSFYEDVAGYIAQQKAERKRAAEKADDPFSDPEVGRLTDEIETAEDVVEAIYERRVGKVVKLASFAAADMSADTNGLTAEEKALFDDLVTRIKQNRETVLDVLAGKRSGSETTANVGEAVAADADVPDPTPTDAATTETPPAEASDGDAPPPPPDVDLEAPSDDAGDVLADAMGAEPDAATGSERDGSETDRAASDGPTADGRSDRSVSADAPDDDRPATEADAVADGPPGGGASGSNASGGGASDGGASDEASAGGAAGDGAGRAASSTDHDRVTLKITRDVGQILGVDEREYDLESEDVVTLPTTNADPLVERGAAERLD